MAEFKYALTRVCLRSGTLTLPGKMLDLFPSEGTVDVLDTKSNEIYELHVRGPRTIAGLAPMFAEHGMAVNDELIIRPMDDGTFAITPVPRQREPDWGEPGTVQRLIDELATANSARTEAEIRALHPYIPADYDLRALLEGEPRLALVEGRWRPAGARARGREDARGHEEPRRHEEERHAGARGAATASDARGADVHRSGGAAAPPYAPRSSVVEHPIAGPYLAAAGLNSEQIPADMRAVNRARTALEHVGFRVEGLGYGQLLASAELGRRTYRVLVHTLPDGDRLDWAALLARRRDVGARYLAVFGDHRDLLRLAAPAELARATLWSWAGLQRMLDLSRTVLVSPIDLEMYFDRGGLFEHGLERFEQTIATRIEERGAFSTVLTRLASMRAPAIFLLEDLAADVELQREQLLRILERLGDAPFHLVTRIDSGEFCLRYRVSDALSQLSDYALSLRDRLPDRKRERVSGLGVGDDGVAASPSRPAARGRSSLAVPVLGDDALKDS